MAIVNVLDFNRAGLEAHFVARGEKPYRGTQVFKWVHQHDADDFAGMTNLGKRLREELSRTMVIEAPQVAAEQTSVDGTRKWLLRIDADNCIETVFIPETGRGTLCVSSQVGCALDCSFCSTGKQGFNRNLSASQIVGQLRVARRRLEAAGARPRVITNVVLMGMGEPLLNFDNVVTAMDVMMDDNGYGLARRRVTLSTVGMVPQIERLRDASRCALAVSLHAPIDELRDQLVPVNRSYPLAELMAACRRFAERDGREPITFEYVMLEGVNDSPAMAGALLRLLRGIPAKINLIPFNPFPGAPYRCPDAATIDRFRDTLLEGGLITITRRTRGADIDAACGQLVGRVRARRPRSARNVPASPEAAPA
jgi:23S rRNA (adenine2503-C2)-methyltransferase